jgi:hypothetical protein
MGKHGPRSRIRNWIGGVYWKRDESSLEYQRARDQDGDTRERGQQDGKGKLINQTSADI